MSKFFEGCESIAGKDTYITSQISVDCFQLYYVTIGIVHGRLKNWEDFIDSKIKFNLLHCRYTVGIRMYRVT